MNGSTMEQHLLNALMALGYEGLRAPGSGTGDHSQPDVLVARQGTGLAGELKSGTAPRNPEPAEIADLLDFARAFRLAAVVVARYKHDSTFYIAPPAALDRTSSGNYRIVREADFPWDVAIGYPASAATPYEPDAVDVRFAHHLEDLESYDDSLAAYLQVLTSRQSARHGWGQDNIARDAGWGPE